MDRSRLEISPGVWLDWRRAVFLATERVLCVADLHLGYEWAHRYAGQMLPIRPRDELVRRLEDLCQAYDPQRLAILGDVVHRAVPLDEIINQLAALVNRICSRAELDLIVGNHDLGLKRLLPAGMTLWPSRAAQGFTLIHSDAAGAASGRIMMGHEHPVISLGDGVRSARFPCFLCGPRVIILPAFSNWAAGCDVRHREFMSKVANEAEFETAVAILGSKLLPVPLE